MVYTIYLYIFVIGIQQFSMRKLIVQTTHILVCKPGPGAQINEEYIVCHF